MCFCNDRTPSPTYSMPLPPLYHPKPGFRISRWKNDFDLCGCKTYLPARKFHSLYSRSDIVKSHIWIVSFMENYMITISQLKSNLNCFHPLSHHVNLYLYHSLGKLVTTNWHYFSYFFSWKQGLVLHANLALHANCLQRSFQWRQFACNAQPYFLGN